jgi:hypothetical protein
MAEFRIVQDDESGRWLIMLYDGPAVNPPTPSLKEEQKKPMTHWMTIGEAMNNQANLPQDFDTEKDARDCFELNADFLRKLAPRGTTGP